MKFQNIHTKEIAELVETDYVSDISGIITIYVLKYPDGSTHRWDKNSADFKNNWKKIKEDDDTLLDNSR